MFMKKYRQTIQILGVLLIFFFVFIQTSWARDPGDPGEPGCDVLDPTCPIDGGLTLLLAAGAFYGIRKYKAGKKETGTAEEM